MNTQEKINKIYEVIADKTLSFGCIGKDSLGRSYISSSLYIYNNEIIEWCKREREDGETDFYPTKIIGHPVMIGDVLDVYGWDTYQKHVAQSDTRRSSAEDIILELWKKKRLSIEEQSAVCIDFIYSLINNGKE